MEAGLNFSSLDSWAEVVVTEVAVDVLVARGGEEAGSVIDSLRISSTGGTIGGRLTM